MFGFRRIRNKKKQSHLLSERVRERNEESSPRFLSDNDIITYGVMNGVLDDGPNYDSPTTDSSGSDSSWSGSDSSGSDAGGFDAGGSDSSW